MVEHPDWNDIKAANELLKEVREGKHPNLHTTAEPRKGHEDDPEIDWDYTVILTKKFIECRECGKTFGMVIYQYDTEVDFECIDCYNEGVKDGI